jgi:TonB family protein
MLLTLVLAACTSASADSLEEQVNNEYRGKVLTLRQVCAGERLHFGQEGRLIGGVRTTSWTTDAQLEVKSLKLKGDVLELRGRRLRFFFDPSTNQLRDVATLKSSEPVGNNFQYVRNKKSWEQFLKSANVEVDLDLPSTPQQEPDLRVAIDKVFVSTNDGLVSVVPAFWKAFLLRKDLNSPPPEPLNDGHVYKVSGEITRPRPNSTPDPEYAEIARVARYSGSAELTIVVTPEGKVKDISIVSPVGLGLDEEAVEAVSRWTFSPGRKGDVPIAVRLSVKVDFHLY